MEKFDLSPGEVVKGKYQVKELIGSGIFSKVYKIWDIEEKVDKALHIYNPIEEYGFSKNAPVVFELLKEMKHSGIPEEFEWFREHNTYVTVEEYIIGTSLRTLLNTKFSKGEKFTFEETLPLIEGVVDILVFAHKYMPHCYLKPEGIFLRPNGNIAITDFGIPYIYGAEAFSSKLIAEGDAYYYLPPEFIPLKGLVDRSADVYSLGILLYEILTGTLPKKEKIPPSQLNPALDRDIDHFIFRCIDDEPRRRFSDIIEFKKEYLYLLDMEFSGKESYDSPFILFDLISAQETEKEEKQEDEEIIEKLFEEPEKEVTQEEPVSLEEPEIKIPSGSKWLIPVVISSILIVGVVAGAFLMTRKKANLKPSVEIVLEEKQKPHLPVGEEKKASPSENTLKPVNPPPEKGKKPQEKLKSKPVQQQKPVEPKPSSHPKKVASITPTRKPAHVKKEKCPPDMVYIPSGYFIMGSAPNDPMRNIGEIEAKKVFVKEFCIDKYEYPNKKGVKPMFNVTYMEAEEECKKVGKRLCTEEEWEKACKGPSNLKYPYGNTWNPDACVTETREGTDRTLQPSGSKPSCKSGYDVYDMSGNLKEWVASLFIKGLPDKVLKGGSYTRPDYATRCATRDVAPPGTRDPEIGFRCCKEVQK